MVHNVGRIDKAVRILSGAALLVAGILAPVGIVVRSIILVASAVMFFTAFSGW